MRILRWMPVLAGAWVVGAMLWAIAQPPTLKDISAAITAREAFVPAPRQVVAPSTVEKAAWSPDGRYLLVISRQHRLTGDIENPREYTGWTASLWDSAQQKATQVGKGGANEEVTFATWLRRNNVALLTVMRTVARRTPAVENEEMEERQQVVMRLDAPRANLRASGVLPEDAGMIIAHPHPVAIHWGASVWVLRAGGSLGAPLELGEEAVLQLVRARKFWSSDGRVVYCQLQGEDGWLALDTVTGEIRSLASAPSVAEPTEPRLPIAVRLIPQEVQHEQSKGRVKALWLEGEKSRVLLCGDAEWAELSPRGNAVFYVSQGAGFVAPLVRLQREQYEELRRLAERHAILSNARQIAVALMMYRQDYDEKFPPGNMDVQLLLEPYLKNETVFQFPGTMFVYVMNEEALVNIDRLSETMVGYIQAPGGRAVIWADGRVTWQSD